MLMKFWLAARWFLLAGGIFLAGMVCAMFIKYPFEKIGDLGTWVAAIGTVGALIGTIYIADTETRRRRQDELTRARLAAARIKQKIAAAGGLARGLHLKLKTAAEIHPPKEEFIDAAAKLRGVAFWAYEDLLALAPIRNGIAFRLAQAQDEMSAAAGVLEAAASRYARFEPDDRRRTILEVADMLLLVAHRLEISWSQCKELIPPDPMAALQ